MKDKIIIVTAFVVLAGLGVGGWWFWHSKQQTTLNSNESATMINADGSIESIESSTSSDSGPSALTVQSASDPLGTLDSPSNGSIQSPSLKITTDSSNQQSTTGSSTSDNASNSEVTLDPTKFTRYDTYKNATSAMYAEIKTGDGTQAAAHKKIKVNYRGWLTNGSVFDENLDKTKPFSFTLGAGSVIAGWEQTISGMKVGGERLLIIPPSAGYGAQGQGPIPANAVLVFYVTLLAVE